MLLFYQENGYISNIFFAIHSPFALLPRSWLTPESVQPADWYSTEFPSI
jgi:hypothetical protein